MSFVCQLLYFSVPSVCVATILLELPRVAVALEVFTTVAQGVRPPRKSNVEVASKGSSLGMRVCLEQSHTLVGIVSSLIYRKFVRLFFYSFYFVGSAWASHLSHQSLASARLQSHIWFDEYKWPPLSGSVSFFVVDSSAPYRRKAFVTLHRTYIYFGPS